MYRFEGDISERNDEGECSASVTHNCITSTLIDHGNSADYMFINCTFTKCYVTNGKGGDSFLEGVRFSVTSQPPS